MAAWKGKYLSVAGKEVLIKSVAQALPIYIMSVFKLPLTLCDELMKQVRASGGVPKMAGGKCNGYHGRSW